jgi:glutamine cyclotransferase
MFRDPETFQIWRQISVKLAGKAIRNLNELEIAKGFIYANVWQTSQVLKIHPGTGSVVTVIDAASLPYRPRRSSEDVLNGIAYVPERDSFLLTGKLWPKVFEVVFE